MTSSESERRKYVEAFTKKLVDDGKLIESGWQAFDYLVLKGAPEEQRREMRKAFFIGAHHLWASLFTFLDSGEAITDADMRRMALVRQELDAFELEYKSDHKPGSA